MVHPVWAVRVVQSVPVSLAKRVRRVSYGLDWAIASTGIGRLRRSSGTIQSDDLVETFSQVRTIGRVSCIVGEIGQLHQSME